MSNVQEGEVERMGFDQARFVQIIRQLYLHANSRDFKNLELLESLLSAHGFLLYCDEI